MDAPAPKTTRGHLVSPPARVALLPPAPPGAARRGTARGCMRPASRGQRTRPRLKRSGSGRCGRRLPGTPGDRRSHRPCPLATTHARPLLRSVVGTAVPVRPRSAAGHGTAVRPTEIGLCRTASNRLHSKGSVHHDAGCRGLLDPRPRRPSEPTVTTVITSRSVNGRPRTPRRPPAHPRRSGCAAPDHSDETALIPRRRRPSTGAALTPRAERQRAPFPPAGPFALLETDRPVC